MDKLLLDFFKAIIKLPKKLLFLIITLLLFQVFTLYAQTDFRIRGTVQDTVGENIIGINIRLISGKDTVYLKSDGNGSFNFKEIKTNKISLYINSVIYQPVNLSYTFQKDHTLIELKPIILKQSLKLLAEVQIKGKLTAVILKRDTIEYNAAAYPVRTDARVDEILKHLPGIQVDNEGNLISEGEPVTKLRVNGKDFFSGNVSEFIKQLPANIIAKLQVIDDYGDQANFIGNKNGNSEKMLNLVTKSNVNSGKFGSSSLNGGTDKRYGISLNGYYWMDNKQISVSNNLNTANNKSGISTINFSKLNYRNKFGKKIEFSSDIGYQSTHNNFTTSSYSESVNTLGTIYENSLNEAINNRFAYSINSTIQYRPDKVNYITVSPLFQFLDEKSMNDINGRQSGVINQSKKTANESIIITPTFVGSFSLSHLFKKPSRALSVFANFNNNKRDNDQDISDRIGYFNSIKELVKDSLLHRLLNTSNKMKSFSFDLTYIEPLTKNTSLDMFYKFNTTKSNNSLLTDVVDSLNKKYLVDSLSNIYFSKFITNNAGLNYRYSGKKITSIVNIAIQKSLTNLFYENTNYNIVRNYTNIIPMVSLKYNLSQQKSIGVGYSGSSSYPSFDQLQSVKDIHNLQNAIVGNPYLRPSFIHSANLNFRSINSKTNKTLFLRINGSIIQNQIVTNILLLKDTLNTLKQETHYLNATGSYNLGASYNYSIPALLIGKIIYNFDLIGNARYGNTTTYSDSKKGFLNNLSFDQAARIWFGTTKMGFDGSTEFNYTYNSYTISSINTSSVYTIQFKGSGWYNISNTLKFNLDASKKIYKGFQSSSIGNPLIINMSIQQQLLKKYGGGVRLTITDLLNQANSIQRITTGNSIIDTQTNYVTRYGLFTFFIQVDRFNKK